MRPENVTLLRPRRLVRVSVPRATLRVHLRPLRRALRVGARHRLPRSRPDARCAIAIRTVASSYSV